MNSNDNVQLVNENDLNETSNQSSSQNPLKWSALWNRLVEMGVAEIPPQRIGTVFLLIVLIVLIVFVMGKYYLPGAKFGK